MKNRTLLVLAATLVTLLPEVGIAFTSAGSGTWEEKCNSEIKFLKQPAVCKKTTEVSTPKKRKKKMTFDGCFENPKTKEASQIIVEIKKGADDSSPQFGKWQCNIREFREDQTKITIHHESGATLVQYIPKSDTDITEITHYIGKGMLTCRIAPAKDSQPRKVKWCGLVDAHHPSTDENPYTDVEHPGTYAITQLLAGQTTLEALYAPTKSNLGAKSNELIAPKNIEATK